jgi:hypothetical protein
VERWQGVDVFSVCKLLESVHTLPGRISPR